MTKKINKGRRNATFTAHNAWINIELIKECFYQACYDKCPHFSNCNRMINKYPLIKENGCLNFPVVKEKFIEKRKEGIFYF